MSESIVRNLTGSVHGLERLRALGHVLVVCAVMVLACPVSDSVALGEISILHVAIHEIETTEDEAAKRLKQGLEFLINESLNRSKDRGGLELKAHSITSKDETKLLDQGIPIDSLYQRNNIHYIIHGKIHALGNDNFAFLIILEKRSPEGKRESVLNKDGMLNKDDDFLFWYKLVASAIYQSINGKTPKEAVLTSCFDAGNVVSRRNELFRSSLPERLRDSLERGKLGETYEIMTLETAEKNGRCSPQPEKKKWAFRFIIYGQILPVANRGTKVQVQVKVRMRESDRTEMLESYAVNPSSPDAVPELAAHIEQQWRWPTLDK